MLFPLYGVHILIVGINGIEESRMIHAHTLHTAEATEEELIARLNPKRMPRHIAIIMDGNRRWAHSRSLPSVMGHREGAKVFRSVLETCRKLEIKVLTAYAFSRENWSRSREEVSILMKLFEFYSKKERQHLHKNGIRFRIIGTIEDLPETLVREFKKTEEFTKDNSKLMLNLAVNYSARHEIVQACREVAQDVRRGVLEPGVIDEDTFSRYLSTANLPDPDLLIRTSGEMRISNFLLWQLAYTELWFSQSYWPDFTPRELVLSILDYQSRERRFGGTKD